MDDDWGYPYFRKPPCWKLSNQHPESTSKASDQRRRISVKDDHGSTLWITGRDGQDGGDGGDEVSFSFFKRVSWRFLLGFFRVSFRIFRVSLGTVGMIGMVGTVRVVRKVTIYTVPVQPM